jgi:hypothetical protein
MLPYYVKEHGRNCVVLYPEVGRLFREKGRGESASLGPESHASCAAVLSAQIGFFTEQRISFTASV